MLKYYLHENPGVVRNLARIMRYGRLEHASRLVILAVDHGMEHGPLISFASNDQRNSSIYDPVYHAEFAYKMQLNAYAAPLGMLESFVASEKYLDMCDLPTILKMNSGNLLNNSLREPDQAFTSSVSDALKLGCSAVGITIYPGAVGFNDSLYDVKEVIREAKCHGLPVVIWAYPRSNDMKKVGETALDVIAYAGHIAAMIGGNIIKIKMPTSDIFMKKAQEEYKKNPFPISTIADRVAYVKRSVFGGQRIILFSGGELKDESELYDEVRAIHSAQGDGSMIGRNAFKLPTEEEACSLIQNIQDIYTGK